MSYLTFDSKDEAEARSREAWEQHLGRKKNPEDVTEFLWPVDVGADGRAAVTIPEDAASYLKQGEAAQLATELDSNWQKETIDTALARARGDER